MEIRVLAAGSKGNCYQVSDGKTPLLLEAGIPFPVIRQKLDFGISELAGCLISHEHGDHAKAVKDMVKAGVDCYMSCGTAEALAVTGHRVHIIEARRQFRVGTWAILPFETVHDAREPLGFLMAKQMGEKLLFATDTAYIAHRFEGLTCIMIEANYSMDILSRNVRGGAISSELRRLVIQNHMSLETLKAMLRANDLSQVEEIWLLHLSDVNSDAKLFKGKIQEISGVPVYIA